MAFLFTLSGCAIHKTYVSEEMLPDGNTWKVNVMKQVGRGHEKSCMKKLNIKRRRDSKVVDCVSKLIQSETDEDFNIRSVELCGKKAHRIFGCGTPVNKRPNQLPTVMCYVECSAK